MTDNGWMVDKMIEDRWISGWMDKMSGWMDKMSGWMDKMSGWIDIHVHYSYNKTLCIIMTSSHYDWSNTIK